MQLRLFESPLPKTDDGQDFVPESRIIAVDFETFYEKDIFGVETQGIWHYINDPRFDAYLVSICDGVKTWVGHPKNFPWDRIAGLHWLAHNAAFDCPVFAQLVSKGIVPLVKPQMWSCTACLANYFGSERNLKAACEYLLGVQVSKEVRGRMSGKTWQDAIDEEFANELIEYARQDAVRCWQLWDKYGAKWPESEQRLAEMTITQGLRGFCVDVPYLGEALQIAKAQLWQAQQSLPAEMQADVEAGKTGISTKALALACRAAGIPVPTDSRGKITTAEDCEEFDEWVEDNKAKCPWVLTLSQVRKFNITLGRLEIMSKRIRPDGCMSFDLKYFNTSTGRWAGGGGYSVHNLLKSNTTTILEPVAVADSLTHIVTKDRCEAGDVVGIPGAGLFSSGTVEKLEPGDNWKYGKLKYAFRINLTKRLHSGHLPDGSFIPAGNRAVLGGSGLDLRGMIIARPGCKLVICDLAQIEPRVLNWLIDNTALLDMIRGGMSIYEAFARVSMGWTGGQLKKEDKHKYAMAKVNVLGLGYGCGARKFKTIAKLMGGLDLSDDECKTAVEEFRRNNPGIPALWQSLELAMKRSLGEDYRIDLPSGRQLVYNQIYSDGGEYFGTGLNRGRRQGKKLYGGVLAENSVQAIARDVFSEGLLRILDYEDQGVNVVFTVHDEAVCEVPVDFDEGKIETAMTTTPDWIAGCPLAAELEVSPRYKK